MIVEPLIPPKPNWWKISVAVSLVIFAAMRFSHLADRPMHNDEGVNAWFVTNLIRDGHYEYDPNNYHGPTLFFIHAAAVWIGNLFVSNPQPNLFHSIDSMNNRSIRYPEVLVGLLVLLGIGFLRNRLGDIGSLAALWLAGLSVDMFYFGRYFIHEMYFVAYTLGIYLGLTYFRDTGRLRYLFLFGAAAGLLFCTKETSAVTFIVLLLASICTEVAYWVRRAMVSRPPLKAWARRLGRVFSETINQPFPQGTRILAVVAWPVMIILIWMLFFSSFGRNWHGLADSFASYKKWTHEGLESGHNKPWPYFIQAILIPDEYPLLVFSLLGMAMAWWCSDKKGLYLSFWTLGMVSSYSLIPYKTVWCVINMVLPMVLLSGYAIQTTFWKLRAAGYGRIKAYSFLVASAALALAPLKRTLTTIYVEYDNETHAQPYVHTSRDVFNLVNRIIEVADQSHLGNDMSVNVTSPEYWPLPYYFRNYPEAKFWGHIPDGDIDGPVLVVAGAQNNEVAARLKDSYVVEEYSLRPGFPLLVYINRRNIPPVPAPPRLPQVLPALASPAGLRPGLVRRSFRNRRFQGTPARTAIESDIFDLTWLAPADKEVPAPFSLSWSGYLTAPVDGTYSFILESDDGSWLTLDDYLVIDNGGVHNPKAVTQTVAMSKGLHKFSLKYFDDGGVAKLRLDWVRPDGQREVIPSDAFSNTPENERMQQ